MQRSFGTRNLHTETAHLDDDEFIARVLRSVKRRVVAGVVYPAFPKAELQEMFVGVSGVAALEEAIAFYRAVKASLRRLNAPLRSDSRVLDFGVGWGRLIRFFAHDVAPEGLFGVDPLESILEVARRCELPANLWRIDPMPPLDIESGTFDLIYAYSVFSHLNATAMDAWVSEFARALRPGGVAIVTTRSRRFIGFCANLRAGAPGPESYAGKLARAFDDREAYETYDAGRVVHADLGLDLANYGETLLPVAYARKAWTRFRVVEFLDDFLPGRNVAYLVMQKPRDDADAGS